MWGSQWASKWHLSGRLSGRLGGHLCGVLSARPSGTFLLWNPLRLSSKELVLEAVAISPSVLQHAAPQLKADREVVLRAVSKNGMVLLKLGRTYPKDLLRLCFAFSFGEVEP